jgi:hypothetical protein
VTICIPFRTAVAIDDAKEKTGKLAVVISSIMAADRDQARVIFRYVGALLRENAMLARRIVRETSESFELTNRAVIEVGSAF